jgi:hypothetical protein
MLGTGESPDVDPRDADFVFVPDTFTGDAVPAPDVLVNMVSFQEMTDAQVRGYAGRAADAGCGLLYSFNRERSPYNPEIVSVNDALADRYQLTEIPVLSTQYTTAMKKPPKAKKPGERSDFVYRHLVGRLREWTAGSGSGNSAQATSRPRVVLGMTLYNNAAHLPEAIESLLAQTYSDFQLVLLDDASADSTEAVARAYAARDRRIKYFRHDTRQAMVATWREVVEIAQRECPSAEYFAWVSDHDRWHQRGSSGCSRSSKGTSTRCSPIRSLAGSERTGPSWTKVLVSSTPSGARDLRARWKHMCHAAVGAGDMVYGLMRIGALTSAGIFRPVLRPDRLLVAELILRGDVRQVPEALWFRRESNGASVDRQRHSLVLAGSEPKWFHAPPWFQHSVALWDTYARAEPPPMPISRTAWTGCCCDTSSRTGGSISGRPKPRTRSGGASTT